MPTPPGHPPVDVVVIGGGITGAGIARDAALRGLTCVLLEKGDFSSGTSAKTTRLVHGGLRYLETGDLHLVAESLREREVLLRLAPHLVHPIPILLPVYRGGRRARWRIRAGLTLYDLLSLGKVTPHYTMLEPRSTLRKVPDLSPEGLTGAGLFYDYQIPFPERLVLENILSAREHGATCLNYHEVTRIEETAEHFRLYVRPSTGRPDLTFSARVVVNATGPWADRLGARYRDDLPAKVRPTKGAHIVVDGDLDHAVFSVSPRDERLFFSIPFEGLTLVGTTDTPWAGDPDDASPEAADIDYLLDGLRALLPGRNFRHSDILWSYAGVRPLALKADRKKPSQLSRRHVLHREGPGGRFLTIVGGKYTTFRRMAEECVDEACRLLGRHVPCVTDKTPLFGGGLKDRVIFREQLCECIHKIPNVCREVVDHLVRIYGRRTCEIIELGVKNPGLQSPVAQGYRDCRAQVAYAVREESASRLDDVIFRRLCMGASADRGLSGAETVARIMASELGWSDAAMRDELQRFQALVMADTRPPR